jgi:hypothetical protein
MGVTHALAATRSLRGIRPWGAPDSSAEGQVVTEEPAPEHTGVEGECS